MLRPFSLHRVVSCLALIQRTALSVLACCAILSPLCASAATPAGSPAASSAAPTREAVEAAITAYLLCDVMDPAYDKAKAQAHMDVLVKLQQAAAQPPDRVVLSLPGGPFKVLGMPFDDVTMMAAPGGFIAFGWSAPSRTASADLLAALKARGYTLSRDMAKGMWPEGKVEQGAVRATPTQYTAIGIVQGRLIPDKSSVLPGGLTVMCQSRASTNAEKISALGDPSAMGLREELLDGERKPKAVVDKLIDKAMVELLPTLASYKWLDAEQVGRLLAKGDVEASLALIRNLQVSFTPEQLNALLTQRSDAYQLMLIRYRLDQLTEPQRHSLKSSQAEKIREAYVLKVGGADGVAALEKMLQSQNDRALEDAMSYVPASSIDQLLQSGSADTRSLLATRARVDYTPAQIARMLQDPVADVRIAVLRRADLAVSREQFDAGLQQPDDRAIYWYLRRLEHVPTEQQIRDGLASQSAEVRRAWALRPRRAPR